MRYMKVVSAALVALTVGLPVQASEPLKINWNDLAPPAEAYSNPFESLETDQMDALRLILRRETALENGLEPSVSAEKAASLRAELEGQGLDVDTLFSQRLEIMEKRRKAALGTNDEVVGQSVRIPGYVLPLEITDGKVIEFLLVPTVGACIHTPPPPANQMIHVTYPEGFPITTLFTPVWIGGALEAGFSQQSVGFSDGRADVEVSYVMNADVVETY